MSRSKREYDVLISTQATKVVTVRAYSMKEAARIIYGNFDREDIVGDSWGTEEFGAESVVDVVRSGDPWHFERHPAALEGYPEGNKNA